MQIRLLDMYDSTIDAIIKGIINIKHKTECLIISLFKLSLLFFLIKVLYRLNALTFSINITGITIIFCKNNDATEKIIPFSYS